MPSQLDALEEELARIRMGGISPITRLLWKHEEDFITEYSREICQGNSKVLDVGCGQGGYLVSLAKEAGNECYGIDPLLKVSLLPALRRATENNVNVQFICGAGENIPFQDGIFDVVLLNSTLQHVANQNQVLHEIKRVLKPDGQLLVSVLQRRGIYSARRFAAEIIRKVQTRETFFTMDFNLKSFKDILTENGFTICKLRGRKFLPILFPSLLSVFLKINKDDIVMKMIELSDSLADKVYFLASTLIALCQKEVSN